MIPIGGDFAFSEAGKNFEQLDTIIEYFNKHNTGNIRVRYSTPSQYFEALNAQELEWPICYNDMFPYGDNPHDYWTGYYTSRPGAKK
jgi:hypothetical protein